MKVRAIDGRCSGHARCASVAPDTFVLDDKGYISVAEIDVPADLEALAARAVRACPERALEISEQ